MGKKILNIFLFVLVALAAAAMTFYVGGGISGMVIYNFAFLAIMIMIYVVGLVGMGRMNTMTESLEHATTELKALFTKRVTRVDVDKIKYLNGIFTNHYLDEKMETFTAMVSDTEEGIGEIEDYINDEELDNHIHKRLLEMVPDILTSLGILGTFVGLVWGLKDFSPESYETMTSSVSSLVDGIKVAFLTSIYGVGFSIVYNFSMKTEYSSMAESLQRFLEKFHAVVMPTAENESRNLLVASQKNQTAAMQMMAEEFSVKMADSFEKVITPAFIKMNNSLDALTSSIIRGQNEAIAEILQVFVKEMHETFGMELADFNQVLDSMTKSQKENLQFTNILYQNLTRDMNEIYRKQEDAVKEAITQINAMGSKYMNTANRINEQNMEIQAQTQQDYQHVVDYLKDAEKSSAKFWVACNQAMQKYVETAAAFMEKASSVSHMNDQSLMQNAAAIEEFNKGINAFNEYIRRNYQTMEEVRRLLNSITAAKDGRQIGLYGGGTVTELPTKTDIENLQQSIDQQNDLLLQLYRTMSESQRKRRS